jgi:hypothetical protein
MRFVTFRTPKPKRFSYKPRYYDKDKETLEKRKAELGYDSELTHRESLRLQMSKKWKKSDNDNFGRSKMSQAVSYIFILLIIVGGIYMIFFTDFIEKLLALFGIR